MLGRYLVINAHALNFVHSATQSAIISPPRDNIFSCQYFALQENHIKLLLNHFNVNQIL